MLTEIKSERLSDSASSGAEPQRSLAGVNSKKRPAEKQPEQPDPDVSRSGRDDPQPGPAGEPRPGEDGDMDADGFPRPAKRRAEEFLPQWLRRLGRG